MAGGNFHRGLVGLHGDQALLSPHVIAGFDHELDHGHFGEVADVGYFDFDDRHVSLLVFWGLAQAYSGLILSAWMPYLAIASATLATGTVPSSLSAFSAATTM